jgi:thiosulfate/3-mercaptopyruvate sulfurtransferase
MLRTIEPLVSTAWLEAHLPVALAVGGVARDPAMSSGPDAESLLVVDLREPRFYGAGHVPGSLSIPFSPMSDWAVSDDELLMELPPDEELFRLLGDWGIGPDSTIVLVGTMEPSPAPPYALADAPRVAATLYYAGVPNVAILDGGYPRWAAEGRPESTEVPAVTPRRYTGSARHDVFVSTEYVKEHLGRAVLIDGRDPDQYFGVTPCPFAGVRGHIPTGRSLPARWMWEEDGSYKSIEELRAVAEGVIGTDRDQKIIAYCGVGGYASAWWFVLARVLGYRNVKIYDGAAEAWAKTESMVSYTW